eukprot:scaffold2313_cov61-Phaeocystis_antarctica.AAC.1
MPSVRDRTHAPSNSSRNSLNVEVALGPPPMSLAPLLGTAAKAGKLGKHPLIPCSPLLFYQDCPRAGPQRRTGSVSPTPRAPATSTHVLGPFEAPLPCYGSDSFSHVCVLRRSSGACSNPFSYYEYAGYGAMSWYAGESHLYDFNAPNRLKLGWMAPQSVVTYNAATGG